MRQAAIKLLRKHGPMHYRKLIQEIIGSGLATTSAKKPEKTLNSAISTDISRNGAQSDFIRLGNGVYGLRALHANDSEPEEEDPEDRPGLGSPGGNHTVENSRRVRIPWFPTYGQVRHLIEVWAGRRESQVTGLHSDLAKLRGTPQNPVAWKDPDTWIEEKLTDDSRELAMAIWADSDQEANPRYTQGPWLLVRQYGLLETGSNGCLVLTDRGRDFIKHQGGTAEVFLDKQEGLTGLLKLISDIGPARFADLVEAWAEYLAQHRSNYGTDSTIRDTLRRRLRNLLDRGLINRERAGYSISEKGTEYIEPIEPPDVDPRQRIRKLAKEQEATVRASLREYLLNMDPAAFEILVALLLEKMDYQNVEVVGQSGDGGVDVIAEIELGVTSVREVVQAKRHKRTVQRKDLDALRGSLYRFSAVRGTIVATSRFAKGAVEAAFAQGAAPITLIDGDMLVDLLIEHGIGIRKSTVEILTVNLDELSRIKSLADE